MYPLSAAHGRHRYGRSAAGRGQAKQAKEPAAGFQQTLRKMKAGTLQ
ncbi:hypothetical protein [Hymenobacter psychrotolerans]|nr:hypothetical protein [Hymenobacter psychrotolerans]